MLEIDVAPLEIILEPVARNTAPPALISALVIAKKYPDALILLMPSDHVIADNDGFHESIKPGIEAAKSGSIVIFGVTPKTPETGFGYIETKSNGSYISNITRFVEKPSKDKAIEYLKSDNFYWNAGIFLFSAKTLIAEFQKSQPEMLVHCQNSLNKVQSDLDFLRLEKLDFENCQDLSIDYANIEKTNTIKCAPLQTEWSDLGAWPAVWDHLPKDEHGNAQLGDVVLHEVNNSLAHSVDGICLTMIGLDNIMAIATKDAVMIITKNHAQNVKQIIAKLKKSNRDEITENLKVFRPWGWYERLSIGAGFLVKCLMIKSGARISLQSHSQRSEHWVVVAGRTQVTLDDREFILDENESTYILLGAKHRLHNPGTVPALLIEVQSGSYLGEDDIVRYEGDFGRTKG